MTVASISPSYAALPFEEGFNRCKLSLKGYWRIDSETTSHFLSLKERLGQATLGILLLIPLINYAVYAILKSYAPSSFGFSKTRLQEKTKPIIASAPSPVESVPTLKTTSTSRTPAPENLVSRLGKLGISLVYFNEAECPQLSMLHRRYPPLAQVDTIRHRPGSTEFISYHGQARVVPDSEILKIHQPSAHIELTFPGSMQNSSLDLAGGKWVLQQAATRGCTAAVTAMLLLDRGLLLPVSNLSGRNLGNTDDMVRDLSTRVPSSNILIAARSKEPGELIEALKKGSIIIGFDGGAGGHVAVLDAVDDVTHTVTIREPYHGWRIDISWDYFCSQADLRETIQVLTPTQS